MTTGDIEAAPVDEVLVDSLIPRVVAAFNAHDADGFVAVMTEDVVFEHSAAPAPMHGRAEVSAFYTNTIWKAFPDLTLELIDGPFFHPHAPRISFSSRRAPIPGRSIHRAWRPPVNALNSTCERSPKSAMGSRAGYVLWSTWPMSCVNLACFLHRAAAESERSPCCSDCR